MLGTSPGNGRLCIAAQGHKPQILDAKIFRRKVEKREEERETELKEGRKEGEAAGVAQISVSHFSRKHIRTSTSSNQRSKI